ncbi:hypothetical protein J2X20_003288 [Pelomonas saccharophila]|uniref:Uncharacterized protein n=1 Tax=Roseateles saccharophilus TaxID=304 RepID=A0ABU1YP45_ROSSA|nr:hypothetical protein [Roseateles saccharophilus]
MAGSSEASAVTRTKHWDAILTHWRRSGIAIRHGVSMHDIEAFQRRLSGCFQG